ncbi:MAG TPA: hypothetical protein DHU55_15295, partial [Blastocatellia bacterium]|nr:hypothetical protein [Blastocatellia bacterium]
MFFLSLSLRRLFKQSLIQFTLTVSILVMVGAVSSSTKAATIIVPAGGDLQSALNAAQFGDTIVVQAGATYATGVSFTLPNKGAGTGTDADYVTVQTSNLAGLAASGVRLNPALQDAALVRLISTGGYPVIDAGAGAHHWKLIGLDISTNGVRYTPDLVEFGYHPGPADHFVVDRCFIHPAEVTASNLLPTILQRSAGRGIGLSASEVMIINSYIAGFAGQFPANDPNVGQNIDSYGIYSPVGPGPFHILNNYIEAQFNNIFLGGSDPGTSNRATISNATMSSATFSNVANLQ